MLRLYLFEDVYERIHVSLLEYRDRSVLQLQFHKSNGCHSRGRGRHSAN